MLNAPNTLPSDPAELRSTAQGLIELAKSQALEIEKLKHQLAGHKKHRFGSRSEAADQLNLDIRLEEEETAVARATPPDVLSVCEPKQKPKRKPLPASLPRHEQVLTPGVSCTCDGALRAIGEDVTEKLKYVP